MRDMVLAARDRGMAAVCFTDHVEMDDSRTGLPDPDWERQRALWYRPSYSASGLSSAKPSRMASSVMEEIHSRSTGFLHPAFS